MAPVKVAVTHRCFHTDGDDGEDDDDADIFYWQSFAEKLSSGVI